MNNETHLFIIIAIDIDIDIDIVMDTLFKRSGAQS